MKSAFCPVIRNNSPPARRQHIAKVCCFPIGTRLNSRQSRKPTTPQSRKPVPLTEPETRAPFRKPSPAPCQSRKPALLFGSPSAPCQSRKPALLFGSPSAPCQSRKPAPLFGSRPLPLARAGNPRPFSEAVPCPLPEPETPLRKPSPAPCQSRKPAPLFGSRRLPFGSPDKAGKPFDTPPGQLFFLVRFADFSCARSRIPAILKPLFNPDRRRLYEKIWLNLCSRVRKRPKKSNLSKGLAHAS